MKKKIIIAIWSGDKIVKIKTNVNLKTLKYKFNFKFMTFIYLHDIKYLIIVIMYIVNNRIFLDYLIWLYNINTYYGVSLIIDSYSYSYRVYNI